MESVSSNSATADACSWRGGEGGGCPQPRTGRREEKVCLGRLPPSTSETWPPHAEGAATWLVVTDEVQSQELTRSEEGGSPPHPVACRGMGEAVYPGGAASGGVLGSPTLTLMLFTSRAREDRSVYTRICRGRKTFH